MHNFITLTVIFLIAHSAFAENVSTQLASHFYQKYSVQSAHLSRFIQDFDRVAGACFKQAECSSELVPLHDSVREQIERGDRKQAVDAAKLFAVGVIKYDSKDQ